MPELNGDSFFFERSRATSRLAERPLAYILERHENLEQRRRSSGLISRLSMLEVVSESPRIERNERPVFQLSKSPKAVTTSGVCG
jgi:hypothetical protein